MPSLRELRTINAIPELRTDVLEQIHACHFEANTNDYEDFDRDHWRTLEIVTFLRSLTTVEDLSISVQFIDQPPWGGKLPSMHSVKSLTLFFDYEMGFNILHVIHFPAITSFNLQLRLSSLDDLGEVIEEVRSSDQKWDSVSDLTLGVRRTDEARRRRSPFERIRLWCFDIKGLKTITLESERDSGHGLFSFASPFDSLRLINPTPSMMPFYWLADIPDKWNNGPHHRATLDMEDINSETKTELKKVVQIVDRR